MLDLAQVIDDIGGHGEFEPVNRSDDLTTGVDLSVLPPEPRANGPNSLEVRRLELRPDIGAE